mgnify:CR=1 FL=1
MNFLFRVLLTINATSWMAILYAIKKGWAISGIPMLVCGILYMAIPVLLSLASLVCFRFLGNDQLTRCQEFSLSDNEFLPIYLGYFFLATGISGNLVMLWVYAIVFVFTFLSQTQYFNPIYILFGYHYYHVLSHEGTRVFVIVRGNVIRNRDAIFFNNLKRINDTTYIAIGGVA